MKNFSNINFYPEFAFRTSRSSGSGGQHVNKVSSKVELIFNVANSGLLTDDEKKTINLKLKSKINTKGELVITCETDRSQHRNKGIAIKKFYTLIESAFKKNKKRIKTKQTKRSKEKRLNEKKRRGEIKKLRNTL